MSEHFEIPPSGLARIIQCEGSLVACKPYAAVDGVAADEGTAAHWVAMQIALASMEQTGGTFPKLGDKLVGGFTVDLEMIAGGEMYAEALEGFTGWAEETILIPRIHPTLCGGTPDFWQYSARTKTLRVTDYKYGHRYVEVFENWQLIAYACGLLDKLAAEGVLHEFETIVELVIVQPRCYHADGPVRTWTTSATNLRTLINLAQMKVEAALAPNPKTHSGPECLYCPARAECTTAHKAEAAILEYSGKVERMPQTGADIGLRLLVINEAIAMLKAVGSGLEEQAMSMINKGKVVPHFKIGHSSPRETWNKTVAEVAMLGMLTGKKLTEETYACTPKQAVSKLKIDRKVIDQYAYTPNGAARLESDPLTKSARIFHK